MSNYDTYHRIWNLVDLVPASVLLYMLLLQTVYQTVSSNPYQLRAPKYLRSLDIEIIPVQGERAGDRGIQRLLESSGDEAAHNAKMISDLASSPGTFKSNLYSSIPLHLMCFWL